jgi:hypothetical protein
MPVGADGTVSFQSDILPMIKARPEFEKFLRGTLEIADTGIGTRISDQAMPHLGGTRMGPYMFQAKWHGANGDTPITLIVDTDIKFFDSDGREITNGRLERAVSLQETFSSMEVEAPR